MKDLKKSGASETILPPQSIIVVGHGPQAMVWAEILKNENLLFSHVQARTIEQANLPDEKIFVILASDLHHGEVVQKIESKKISVKAFVFAHGYSKTFGLVETNVPCLLVAPKAIAPKVLEAYQGKKEVSFVIDSTDSTLLDLAKAIAFTLGGSKIIEATFQQEAYCDLFTEQTLLCFGLPVLLQKSHEFLASKGIPADLAATELMEESLLMLEMIRDRGISGMLSKISTTALVGASQGSILDFERIWSNIESNKFHEFLLKEVNSGNEDAKKFIEKFRKESFDVTRNFSVEGSV